MRRRGYLSVLWGLFEWITAQGSYGHEKSWKVMEFENSFSRPGKVMDFRQNGQGHGKVMEFNFFGTRFRAV